MGLFVFMIPKLSGSVQNELLPFDKSDVPLISNSRGREGSCRLLGYNIPSRRRLLSAERNFLKFPGHSRRDGRASTRNFYDFANDALGITSSPVNETALLDRDGSPLLLALLLVVILEIFKTLAPDARGFSDSSRNFYFNWLSPPHGRFPLLRFR